LTDRQSWTRGKKGVCGRERKEEKHLEEEWKGRQFQEVREYERMAM
jgi:hypothetical protein